MSFVGPILSGIGAVGSLFGRSSAPSPQSVQMPGTKQAANDFLSANRSQYNMNQGTVPAYQSLVSQMQNNPYGGQAMAGANAGAGYGAATAADAFGNAQQLSGLSDMLVPYASQYLTQAFDPQQDLYNRTLHGLEQQNRAGQSARGIAMTPYGAGLENQARSNFNIDWQNNLLSRMGQGIQGVGSLANTIGQGYTGAAGLGEGASQLAGASGMLPNNTYNQLGTQGLDWLNALSTARNAGPQQYLSNLQGYLGLGNSANANALSAANMGFNQNQQMGQNLGNSLSSFGQYGQNSGFFGGLANLFGGGGAVRSGTGMLY